MALIKVNTLEELVNTSNDLLRSAAQDQQAFLVVPSQAWGDQRKLQLRSVAPLGVQVATHALLVEQLWDLYGDGRGLVSGSARKVLLRPLISQTGLLSQPSPRFVAQLADFVQEAVYPGLEPACPLSESQSQIMELVSLYEQRLSQEGLIEPAQAERLLIEQGVCAGLRFVFESPNLHSAHMRNFIAGLESNAQVSVIQQQLSISPDHELTQNELVDLRHWLFTGKDGLQPQGQVRVVEARGAHAKGDALVGLLQAIHQQDAIPYDGIAVCMSSAADAYPQTLQCLAHAGIPFQTSFSLPVANIGLGAAFQQADLAKSGQSDDRAFTALVDLASSPYSGISNEDARALQTRWRERAHSTIDNRLEDITNGFGQGGVDARDMKKRLEPLARLLDDTPQERVRLMFQNAHQAHLDVDTLIDDRQAADAILDYLDLCERFLCDPDMAEVAAMPVQVSRSFNTEKGPVSLISPDELCLQQFDAVVLTGLDAEHYPMAKPAGPFDELMLDLGINNARNLAQEQRIMLLNTIESASKIFSFGRATHIPQGDESCQSALFDELVGVYRTKADEDDHVPPNGIPQALQPWLCFASEESVLQDSVVSGAVQSGVTRGSINNSKLYSESFLDKKGNEAHISPTALETYFQCPYRWFTSRKISFNPMDVKFDALAQGNLVHDALEQFYIDFIDGAGYSRVTPENLPEALEIAAQAFDACVERNLSPFKKGPFLKTQADILACADSRRRMLDLVRRDATFLPGFSPKWLELELKNPDGSLLEYAGVKVRGKVDRVDVDQNNNAIVIDYKLSKLNQGYGLSSKQDTPERIQTDIYATLVQRHFDAKGEPIRVLGSVYRSYATNNLRGVYDAGVDWGSEEIACPQIDALPREDLGESYQQYLDRIEDVVSGCVKRLKAGDIKPDPISDEACRYCAGRLFCPKEEV